VIGWEEFFLVLPLMLPDVLVSIVAVWLVLRRRRHVARGALPWLLLPTGFLGLSAMTRMMPIYVEPVQEFVEWLFSGSGDYELMIVWFGDMFLRLPAWAALLYGLFWKLPMPAAAPPLDARARQAAATAALLAVMLAEKREG